MGRNKKGLMCNKNTKLSTVWRGCCGVQAIESARYISVISAYYVFYKFDDSCTETWTPNAVIPNVSHSSMLVTP